MNTFYELESNQLRDVNGGAFPVLFVVWGVSVTVGHALTAGATIGLVAGGMLALKNN